MVSQSIVCLTLLAMVALSNCMSFYDPQTIQSNQGLQDMGLKQQNRKTILIQDTSADESKEIHKKIVEIIKQTKFDWGKKMKAQLSQEDNNSYEIRQAQPERMFDRRSGPSYSNGQEVRENIQGSRTGNDEFGSNENNSQEHRNQIGRY